MTRAFESWWWTAASVGLFAFWGGCFPSEPREHPRMFIATHAALGVSLVMCALALGSWFLGRGRRAR